MLLHNVMRHKVASALVGQPKLDNVFTSKKKKGKAAKVAKGPYGLGGYGGIYTPVDSDGDSGGGGGGGDGGGGGGE